MLHPPPQLQVPPEGTGPQRPIRCSSSARSWFFFLLKKKKILLHLKFSRVLRSLLFYVIIFVGIF